MRWLITLSFVFSLVGPARAEEGAWARHSIGETTITVELPGSVKRERTENNSFGGSVINDILSTPLPGGWLSATVSAAPPLMVRLAGDSLIWTTTKSAILGKATQPTTLDWQKVIRDGIEGRRLVYRALDDSGKPCTGVAEVFVRDHFIVTLHARLAGEATPAGVETFFTSVKLPGPTP